MAFENFSNDNTVITVNGRSITDWGQQDPPISMAPIDPASVVRRGVGGNAVRLDRKNPGARVTLYLNPGSSDAAYLRGLFNSRANVTFTYEQIGTPENTINTEGAIVNVGERGRGGASSITDEQFMFEFNSGTTI